MHCEQQNQFNSMSSVTHSRLTPTSFPSGMHLLPPSLPPSTFYFCLNVGLKSGAAKEEHNEARAWEPQ